MDTTIIQKLLPKLSMRKVGSEFHARILFEHQFHFSENIFTKNFFFFRGWMHSGDIGYYDEDGEVYVIDRFKELIKYRGYHISPVEIEEVLLTHPGVKEVAVVGLPHPIDDEWPIAFVIKTDSSVYNKQVCSS